jgi:phosphoribosylglycinamide formyltransferase-1
MPDASSSSSGSGTPTPIPAPTPVAVLVSGTGTNMVALAEAIAAGSVPARIVAVISDVADAPALARAAALGLATGVVPFDRSDRAGWERALTDAVAASGAHVVVLAGFMRILGTTFLSRWPDRVINVHPSLLPAFRGAHAVDDAIAAGATTTGVSVHLVDELVDHGPVLAQEPVDILPGDTRASLLERLHVVEHRLLPACVAAVCEGRVRITGGHAIIEPAEPAAPAEPIDPTDPEPT